MLAFLLNYQVEPKMHKPYTHKKALQSSVRARANSKTCHILKSSRKRTERS